MRRVAILLTSEPQFGGEHQYLILLMESLARLDKKKFSVLGICNNYFWIVWCKKHGISFVRYKGESYSPNFMKVSARFPALFRIFHTYRSVLGKIILENRIHLLIVGQQGTFIPPVFCKKIQPVHDLMHRFEPDFPEIMSTYHEREALFSSNARHTDVVLVDSQLGKKQYRECYYNKKKTNPQIEVLPFVASGIKRKQEEYIETPSKFLFYPAQFWEHKNHINLLLAINLLKKNIPDIHLILVGSEKNSLKKIKKIIQDHSLENHVSIAGFVSDGQIVYLYRHAVAMVMTTYFGPTNIPPLEAMALGCPVIVSNKYAMHEQVGEAGILCDPDSPEDIARCILEVWNDSEVRKKMIQKGYGQSKKWKAVDFKKRFIEIVLRELKNVK